MKALHITMRNILILGAILVLTIAVIGLVNRQRPQPQTAQTSLTATPLTTTTATSSPPRNLTPTTTATPLPSATATLWPATQLTPVASEPYLIFQITPIAGPTYTPTPTPVAIAETATPIVSLSSDGPLLSEAMLDAMQVKDSNVVWVKEWPQAQDLTVTVQNAAGKRYWHVSLDTGQTQLLPNYKARPDTTAAVAELKQYDDRAKYVDLSPDGKWVTWGLGETLLVKALGTDTPPVNLLGKVEFEEFWGGVDNTVWLPSQDRLAYVIRYSFKYQIRISDPLGKETLIIPLEYTPPHYLAWSADGQYLAFEMLEEKQSGINHIYVIKSDGTGLTQLTQHGSATAPVHWSPTGDAIIYKYDIGGGSRPWIAYLTKP